LSNISFTVGLLLVLGVCLVFLLLLAFIFFPPLIGALSNEVHVLAIIIAHSFASSPWLFSFVSLESSSFSHELVVVLDGEPFLLELSITFCFFLLALRAISYFLEEVIPLDKLLA
jgi:hypothetical protein